MGTDAPESGPAPPTLDALDFELRARPWMKIAGLDRIETANGDAHLCLDIVPIDLNLLFTWFDLLAAALRLNGINPEDDLSIEYTFVSGAAYKGFRMLLRAGTDTQTLASYCLMAALRALPI